MNLRLPAAPSAAPLSLALVLSLACGLSSAIGGDHDWPQWRGPQRNGHAAPQPLLDAWPEGGPKLKWEFDQAGEGYSSVAVRDGRLYTLGSQEGRCFAVCLDASTGERIWKSNVSRASTGDDYMHGWGGGPRSTPTVDGEQVFVLSDVGVVAALDRRSGSIQWKVDLVAEHGGSIPKWGYSESVLLDDDRVVVTPGGSPFMIGLDRASGDKVWESQGFEGDVQYVSCVRGDVDGVPFYVTAAASGLVAFHRESGELLFQDETTGNPTAVIPTPIVDGRRVYHTSDYGAGNTLLELRGDGAGGLEAKTVYHLEGKTMRNHHGGVVLVDGVIYGFTRANGGTWMAQDLESGEVLWEEKIRPNRSGSIAYGNGRLYCYNDTDGSVFLVEPNREGWQPRGEMKLPRETELPRDRGAIWAHPVIADQTLFLRDQNLLFAFDIAADR